MPEPLSNDNRRSCFDALNRWQAQYLVIGAHAVGVYAEPRGTKDLDIWINPTKRNARRVLAALREFGAQVFGTTESTITDKEDFLVIGVAPNRIDILKSISGLRFPACWKNRRTFDIHGTTAHLLNLQDLLTAKLAAGRPQDLADAAKLMKTLELESGGSNKRPSRVPPRQASSPAHRSRGGGVTARNATAGTSTVASLSAEASPINVNVRTGSHRRLDRSDGSVGV